MKQAVTPPGPQTASEAAIARNPAPCPEPPPAAPRLYNLGAGALALLPRLPQGHCFAGWREIRVDIDPRCRPDIRASLTDLTGAIADGAADLIYCSHVLEHFHDHEVPLVLAECHRILHPLGAVVLRVPDLAQIFAAGGSFDPDRLLYPSPAGPITVLDVIYGHRASVAAGNGFMAHRTGFSESSLARRLLAAGFDEVRTRSGTAAEFCAIATRSPLHDPPQDLPRDLPHNLPQAAPAHAAQIAALLAQMT